MSLVKDQYNITEPWQANKTKPVEDKQHTENSRPAEKRSIPPAAEKYSPSRHTNTDSDDDSSDDNDDSKRGDESGIEKESDDEAASNSDSEVGVRNYLFYRGK